MGAVSIPERGQPGWSGSLHEMALQAQAGSRGASLPLHPRVAAGQMRTCLQVSQAALLLRGLGLCCSVCLECSSSSGATGPCLRPPVTLSASCPSALCHMSLVEPSPIGEMVGKGGSRVSSMTPLRKLLLPLGPQGLVGGLCLQLGAVGSLQAEVTGEALPQCLLPQCQYYRSAGASVTAPLPASQILQRTWMSRSRRCPSRSWRGARTCVPTLWTGRPEAQAASLLPRVLGPQPVAALLFPEGVECGFTPI